MYRLRDSIQPTYEESLSVFLLEGSESLDDGLGLGLKSDCIIETFMINEYHKDTKCTA